MLADTPLPHGFGAALASVDTLSKGSRTVRYLPALPCKATCDGTHGLIEFLLSRQSFSAASQVALWFADHPDFIDSDSYRCSYTTSRICPVEPIEHLGGEGASGDDGHGLM